MVWDKRLKEEVLLLIKAGYPVTDIAKDKGIPKATIYAWLRTKKKDTNEKESANTIKNIQKQLETLSAKKEITETDSRKIAMLTRSLNRLLRIKEIQKKKKKRPSIDGMFSNSKTKVLREKVLSKEYGLFEYQKRFLSSHSQFRLVLKSRQIGFSYVSALDALLAALSGRNQLFLSASEEQAIILMRYVGIHAKKLGIKIKESDKEIKINDAIIKAMAHNFRTVQGFTGDIWMDEFAWYPNPKRIWHAFVPSIGAIKGRLTIISTPFESGSLFEELYRNQDRYYMFERFKVDIYDAIKDGLDFDLETMKSLFDADTWASAYECQFIDDDAAAFGIHLIKSCVDPNAVYFMPPSNSLLFAGYDIGRTKDKSALASIIPHKDIYKLANLEVLAKASFAEQKSHLINFLKTYPLAQLAMDKTGIGMNLTEDIKSIFKQRITGVYFTNTIKEFLVLNLKKLFEDKRIIIPNDQQLIRDIHSIKRLAAQKSFKYDSNRTTYGHADRFWALALAASHIEEIHKRKKAKAWII